jgi:hypothetical protein
MKKKNFFGPAQVFLDVFLTLNFVSFSDVVLAMYHRTSLRNATSVFVL